MSTRRLERRSDRVSGLMSLRSARYSIQSRSAETKMSAGAPCSICLASAELAAYETTAHSPLTGPPLPLGIDLIEGSLEARGCEHEDFAALCLLRRAKRRKRLART